MNKIREFLKKVGPNKIILFDIIFIVIIFLIISKYSEMKNPTFAKKYSKDFEYIAKINRHKFKKNEIVVINIEIKNRGRKEVNLKLTTLPIFNVDIYKDKKIVFRREYIERVRENEQKMRIGAFGKINLGNEWNMNCDGEVNKIDAGNYEVRVYSNDLGVDLIIPFEIEEGKI